MKKGTLKMAEKECKAILVDRLKEYVKRNGRPVTPIDRNLYGLYDEYEGFGTAETTVVLKLNDEGCWFVEESKPLADVDFDGADLRYVEKELERAFDLWCFQCLYIVKDDCLYEPEHLKYFALRNGGVCFNDFADMERGDVEQLPLSMISKMVEIVDYLDSKRKKQTERKNIGFVIGCF